MQYKILWIKGSEKDYRRRIYIVSKIEFDELKSINTFVIRETKDGEKIYKSCESGNHYMIT